MTLDSEGSEYYQINKILDYCGYKSRFGFKVERPGGGGLGPDHQSGWDDFELEKSSYFAGDRADFEHARQLLSLVPNETIWIDPANSPLDFSLNREFAAVLRNEPHLRKANLLRRIHFFLERKDGSEIEIHHASSGELSLISSLVFLITTAKPNSIVIVDEPENSLHPGWQREYVDKVLAALMYRNVSIIIATHAPLIVTGAITLHPGRVSVHRVINRQPHSLHIPATSNGIEEVLWRAFEVVTPANHFVSEEIVEAIHRYEHGALSKKGLLGLVDGMEEKSFDGKQKEFFEAVRSLIQDIAKKNGEAGL
ncbi:AAA family ATPase [Caenispirillum bisanense]|uniref:AAA family ATPase n=1 Tax=Caenispirillum bisanense TaxID=414052 RepID=UPI0031CE63FC